MSSVNKKAKSHKKTSARLAGGFGSHGAKQDAEALLRRAVMANLLWENLAYESGSSVVDTIKELVPQVRPSVLCDIAIEARTKQKLRHVPLLIAREMLRYDSHRQFVGDLLPKIILRADELTEFVAIYWKEGKVPLANQAKKGLALAFANFNEYQFAKYSRNTEVTLRDVMFLVHPSPSQDRVSLYKRIANNELKTPDTWEVALSTGEDKKSAWERLISENKLGALAFLRNLRNMDQAGVSHEVIKQGFSQVNPSWLLPLNYLSAETHAPRWSNEIESLMLRGLSNSPKLKGHTVFIVDVSGSMTQSISGRSNYSRLDVAIAMTVMAREVCEDVTIYATAGSDSLREHRTELLPAYRGFALRDTLRKALHEMGNGGIFTRQCLEDVQSKEQGKVDRIIIFSDSQDCDYPHLRTPKPFADTNYIIDVSSHRNGINYDGVWTAEVSGWSEHFIEYIMALEGVNLQE